jgi:two-component system chemotaxis response regulator CheB
LTNRDILAIGTSAGGVEALHFLAGTFPRDFPAAILIVIHLSSRSTLDAIMTEAGPLAATFAKDGERLERSRIYIGPAERHLLVVGGRLRLGTGPQENYARPAIDVMFRSIALSCAARAIGVVLTGTLGDGAGGLKTLKQCGGITVVQDPNDAAYPEMPAAALRRSRPDRILTLAGMPALFNTLVREPAGTPVPVPKGIEHEVEISRAGRSSSRHTDAIRPAVGVGAAEKSRRNVENR